MNIENLRKNSIYSPLYDKYGEDYIINAGYFENEEQNNCLTDEELIESLKFLCTPLPDISQIKDNSIILLNTGCYNPLHEDHIEMMKLAKDGMEKLGFHVLQGYFAPDADTYVKTKTKTYLNINQRCELISNMVNEYDWLNVDSWSGTFIPTDVNFTTIYRRLELYVERYLYKHIPIYYVCGSDRANFSFTFEDKTIIIERNYDYTDNGLDFHPNAKYFYPKTPLTKSSTEIRKSWNVEKPEKSGLILRVEEKNQIFQNILNDYYKEINFEYQFKQNKVFSKINKNLISLDSLLRDRYSLEISRYFNLGGCDFIKYDSRIGSTSLETQVSNIPKDLNYYLFDDDTYTGGTFKFARELFKNHNILGEITLVKSNINDYEVLDLRDFILGYNNGLGIIAPNGHRFRVPYVYPFVNPYIRASIIDPIGFSKHIWQINYELYYTKYRDVKVKFCSSYDCFRYVGFDDEMEIYKICEYFRDKL